MTYAFTSNDGLAKSNDAAAIERWNAAGQSYTEQERVWVEHMKSLGVVIATPDDGWVDRTKHTVHPPHYARLDNGAKVGDLIALGNHEKWRVVKCTEVNQHTLMSNTTYSFDPEPIHTSG